MKHFGAVLALCLLCVTLLALVVLQVRNAVQEKKLVAPRSDFPNFSEPSNTGDNHSRIIAGYWAKKDPSKILNSPVQIHCTVINLKCIETRLMVSTHKIEEKEWNITTWDSHRLIASYGDDPASPCLRHVLTMNFDSRAVVASDIPTHRKGCEAFTETKSYDFVHVRDSVRASSRDDM